jgi:hypothetical protein
MWNKKTQMSDHLVWSPLPPLVNGLAVQIGRANSAPSEGETLSARAVGRRGGQGTLRWFRQAVPKAVNVLDGAVPGGAVLSGARREYMPVEAEGGADSYVVQGADVGSLLGVELSLGKTVARCVLPVAVQSGGDPAVEGVLLLLEEHVHNEQCRKQCCRIGLTMSGADDHAQDRAMCSEGELIRALPTLRGASLGMSEYGWWRRLPGPTSAASSSAASSTVDAGPAAGGRVDEDEARLEKIPEAAQRLVHRLGVEDCGRQVLFRIRPARRSSGGADSGGADSGGAMVTGAWAASSTLGPVLCKPPFVASVKIAGDAFEGETLYCTKRYSGGREGASRIRWLRIRPDGAREEARGWCSWDEGGKSLALGREDVGCKIKAIVLPVRADGVEGREASSMPTDPVEARGTLGVRGPGARGSPKVEARLAAVGDIRSLIKSRKQKEQAAGRGRNKL